MMMDTAFFKAFDITRDDVVCLTGAGGKTALLYRLAEEARTTGYRVLVTTTTKLFMPRRDQYDALDLSGALFAGLDISGPGIYFGVSPTEKVQKVGKVADQVLADRRNRFDLVLIEADGAAQKPLKGWKSTEPVIPGFTTKTIGVLDIQTLGKSVCDTLVHHLELFCNLTGARPGDQVTLEHLTRLVCHEQGLFQNALGQRLLYINKVETGPGLNEARRLARSVPLIAVTGSLARGIIYDPA